MKRRQQWQHIMWGGWGLLSIWALGFSKVEPPTARMSSVLGLAILSYLAIVLIAPEVRSHPITYVLGVELLGSLLVLGASSSGAVAKNALMVAALVIGLAIWTVMADRAFFQRVRYWRWGR